MTIKKTTKIVTVLLIIATLLAGVNMVFGVTIPGGTATATTGGLSSTIGNIIGVVQFICYAAAVILLVMLGVKFMTASPDGKAEVKKSAVIYVVGAVLVFASGLILNLVKNMADKTIITA